MSLKRNKWRCSLQYKETEMNAELIAGLFDWFKKQGASVVIMSVICFYFYSENEALKKKVDLLSDKIEQYEKTDHDNTLKMLDKCNTTLEETNQILKYSLDFKKK